MFCPQPAESKSRWAVVSVPVADLRSDSGSAAISHDYDPKQETQLLYGEGVEIVSASGDWLKVNAIEQPEFSHNNRWEGYPGWIKKSAVTAVKKIPFANFVVRKKTARLFAEPKDSDQFLILSLGARIFAAEKTSNGFRKVRMVSGKEGWVRADDLRPAKTFLSDELARKIVLDAASELLGDLYFWGGRAAHISELADQVTAVDCSGLVNLAYRVAGKDIPRDSYELFLQSRKIARKDLKMGDLIFFAAQDKPGKVSHVAIFVDEKTLIEAPKTGEVVRKVDFAEKVGVNFSVAESSQLIGERFIYFGTYFPPPSP